MAEFVMPTLGANMTAGTLISWLKKPGDRVARGDIIATAQHEAERQSLTDLMKNFSDLVNRTRIGALRNSEFSDLSLKRK